MKDKLKIFEYLDTLVRMCRSKSDGNSLKIEEDDITYKINELDSELQDLNSSLTEDVYDESAEMADRNLEIVTKKAISTLKSKIKEKEEELAELQTKQAEINNELAIYKDNSSSIEETIKVMQERIATCENPNTIKEYQEKINNSEQLLKEEEEKSSLINVLNTKLSNSITSINLDIEEYQIRIAKKEELLNEVKTNLQSKESYIDDAKKNRLDRRIKSLEEEKERYNNRLKEIHKDPKFLETKIKSIINDGADTFLIRGYLIDLLNAALQVPYMNVPLDNNLEAELLKATQARDSFANEIDHKSYAFTDLVNPINIRIEYLEKRINNLNIEKENLISEINLIDSDETYEYHKEVTRLEEIIEGIKQDISEYTIALEKNQEELPSVKAQIKSSLDTKKDDLCTAETICDRFRKEEANYISKINNELNIKLDNINKEIEDARKETQELIDEQLTKNVNLADIRLMNKDKERLKDLAKVVVDIKHRKTFPLKPLDIAKDLERKLGILLVSSLDIPITTTEDTSSDETGSSLINDLIMKNITEIDEQYHPDTEEIKVDEDNSFPDNRRGYKVISEIDITPAKQENTFEDINTKYENHINTLNKMNEDINNQTIEEIEKELDLNNIDNVENNDNIIANQKLVDELDEYIRNLDHRIIEE